MPPVPPSGFGVARARAAGSADRPAGPFENKERLAVRVLAIRRNTSGCVTARNRKDIADEERRERMTVGRLVIMPPSIQQAPNDHAPQAGPATALYVDDRLRCWEPKVEACLVRSIHDPRGSAHEVHHPSPPFICRHAHPTWFPKEVVETEQFQAEVPPENARQQRLARAWRAQHEDPPGLKKAIRSASTATTGARFFCRPDRGSAFDEAQDRAGKMKGGLMLEL